ncbi:hypothetical protein D4R71_00395 [bacterium]|nr:MAG: hypothetical protein D4R71_00395 [bacterium]
MNSITIKNENNGVQRTIYTHQSVGQIAEAAHQQSLFITRMRQTESRLKKANQRFFKTKRKG